MSNLVRYDYIFDGENLTVAYADKFGRLNVKKLEHVFAKGAVDLPKNATDETIRNAILNDICRSSKGEV